MTRIRSIGLPIVILFFGALLFAFLISQKKEPEASVERPRALLVRGQKVEQGNWPLVLESTGVVKARRETRLSPQVSGRISWLSPRFVVGGRFDAGETLFRIERSDYENKLAMAAAEVAGAEVELEITRAKAIVATEEWELLSELEPKGDAERPPNKLVLYEPQLRSAVGKLKAAKASFAQAKLDLERTEVKAPFACLVREKSFDLGQYVRAGEVVAALLGTEQAEVFVSLPPEDFVWFARAWTLQDHGLRAEVSLEGAGQEVKRDAVVSRVLGEVDPLGRMNQVVVSIERPFDESLGVLSIGAFVKVRIYAASLDNALRIPRTALRDGDLVWVFGDQAKLGIRPVEVVYSDRDYHYLKDGLSAGETVIVSNITGAVSGMSIRMASDEVAAE